MESMGVKLYSKRRSNLAVIFLLIIVLVGCLQKERRENFARTVKKGNQFYVRGETRPFTGTLFSRYKNGGLLTEAKIKDGFRQGITEVFHENGKLKSQMTFSKGKVEGRGRAWFENGQLRVETHYKNGEKVGLTKNWKKTGEAVIGKRDIIAATPATSTAKESSKADAEVETAQDATPVSYQTHSLDELQKPLEGVITTGKPILTDPAKPDSRIALISAPFDSKNIIKVDGREIISNQIRVTFSTNAGVKDIQNFLQKNSYKIIGKISSTGNYLLNFPAAFSLAKAHQVLKQSGLVKSVSYNRVIRLAQDGVNLSDLNNENEEDSVPKVMQDYTKSWGWKKIAAEAAWKLALEQEEYGKSECIIAILDSGIDLNHTEFLQQIIAGPDFFAEGGDDGIPEDEIGHGTNVAGIAAAAGAACNPGIGLFNKILVIKIFGPDSTGCGYALDCATEWLARWVRTKKQRVVVNCSLAILAEDERSRAEDKYYFRRLLKAGCLVTVAAGNFNQDAVNTSPAFYKALLCVGAIDSNDKRDSYSNFGSLVDVSAPGVEIYTAKNGGGYMFESGTSMACPFVTGLAALIWNVNPELSPRKVSGIIKSTAVPINTDKPLGRGRINAFKAVQKAIEKKEEEKGKIWVQKMYHDEANRKLWKIITWKKIDEGPLGNIHHGPEKEFNEKGQLIEENNWKNGKKQGWCKRYFPNGQVEEKTYFKWDLMNGKSIRYHENGKIYEVYHFKNNKEHGAYKKFFESGKMEYQGEYNKGKISGHWLQLSESGKKVEDSNYLKGKRHGLLTKYDEDGRKDKQTNYKNGLKQGKEVTYWNNKIHIVSNYKKDRLHGEEKLYHQNGKMSCSRSYKNGLEHGTTRSYDEKGKLLSELKYVNGKRVK
ncbi:S8 family serine peptidase [Candidatus Riflebacteria bacterium]